MSLKVGVDSYVTLEEAENIIDFSSVSSDEAYIKWSELSDRDKEVLLRNSCRDLNNLKYSGRKARASQNLAFPRVDSYTCGIGYRLFIGQLYDNGLVSGNSTDGGLSLAKQAQVVNALYGCIYSDLATNQIAVSIQGLTSKKAGPIAETYKRDRTSEDALMGIYTKKVYSLLRPWINDSRINF